MLPLGDVAYSTSVKIFLQSLVTHLMEILAHLLPPFISLVWTITFFLPVLLSSHHYPQGALPLSGCLVVLAYSNQCLVLRRRLSCKAGPVVGCRIGL